MKKLFLLFAIYFSSVYAWAYPELIRHGYPSCTNCHISPGGGGILTPYGRSLANELLTHSWKEVVEDSEGKKMTPAESGEVVQKWLSGGDLRVLFFHHNNEYENSYLTIPMQVELAGAYNTERYAFVLSAQATGSKPKGGEEADSAFRIANAYGLYRLNDKFSIRAGRFLPAYGLNNSLHTLGTRGPLGFGFKDQRNGVELSYLSEKWGVIVSQFGNRESNVGDDSTTAQFQIIPNENSKFAINYWTEKNLRSIYGLWFVTPIYGPLYISADYNTQIESSPKTDGRYYFAKLGYEIKQGIHLYVMKDFYQRDMDLSYTKVDRIGPGIQIFPILHFEVDAVWLRETNRIFSNKEADYAYILAHYYL